MFRPTSRLLLRNRPAATASRSAPALRSGGRRTLSTAPPAQRSRSWKSSALRWGLAIGGLYYYNTSKAFAEEPGASFLPNQPGDDTTSSGPTLDSFVVERRQRLAAEQRAKEHAQVSAADEDSPATQNHSTTTQAPSPGVGTDAGSPDELEEEAESEGAFNPETGEINWDCPCLGGMAHGPCGPEFREAFSCFVYSKEEPKGMDCIDRFKGMQDCFRQHPDVYGAELEEDEDGDAGAAAAAEATTSLHDASQQSAPATPQTSTASPAAAAAPAKKHDREDVVSQSKDQDESEGLVPKSAHDARRPEDLGKGNK